MLSSKAERKDEQCGQRFFAGQAKHALGRVQVLGDRVILGFILHLIVAS
uniref:Uncharacterized protein n=1 Tax=Vibrio genomosp. F6 TaxID=723172 RepID=A0A0H3ZLR6_9VIBR|nr:hypothetical protein [Vibrio genomosp. F6]